MDTTPTLNDRILIPLDGSTLAEQALPFAEALAAPGAELILVHITTRPEPATAEHGAVVAPADEVWRGRQQTVREEIEARVRHVLRRDDLRLRIETAIGDPAAQILAMARAAEAGLIVMAGHGRGALGRWTFGSVADRVSRAAPLPVVVVRAEDAPVEIGESLIRRLVVPLDGSPVAAQALPVAAALARRLHVPILLVSAVDPGQGVGPVAGYGAAFSDEVYDEVLSSLTFDARQMLEQTGAGLASEGIPTNWQLLAGSPAAAVMDVTVRGDLVVMTSHGRSGISRWLLGSVAEKLVRSGPAPVMLVRATPAVRDVLVAGGAATRAGA